MSVSVGVSVSGMLRRCSVCTDVMGMRHKYSEGFDRAKVHLSHDAVVALDTLTALWHVEQKAMPTYQGECRPSGDPTPIPADGNDVQGNVPDVAPATAMTPTPRQPQRAMR